MQAGITGWAALLCIAIPYSAHADNGEIRVLMAQQQFADWHMVTVMEGNAPHSLVAFNTAEPQPTEHTIWLRPNEDFSNWDAITWPGAEASMVVTAIKQEVGIPQDFDHLWPVFPADGIGIPIGRPFGERPEEGIINLLDPSHVQNTFPDLDPDWQSTRTELFESPCGYHEALGAITLESRYVSGLYADVAPLVIDDSLALTFCEEDIAGEHPTVEIVTLGDVINTSYRGEKFYLTSDDVRFTAMSSDIEDGSLPTSLLLNDEPYIHGTPITESGDYMLKAIAIDVDGNADTDSILFTIQAYTPLQSAIQVIAVEPYTEDRDTQLLKVTVLILSEEFDVRDIDVCTIRLLAEDPVHGGLRYHVDGAWDPTGFVQTPENADAGIVINDFVCVFSGIPESADLDSLQVIGGGLGFPYSFSFWETSPVVMGIEDPRMDDNNPVELVDQNVSPPDCGLKKKRVKNTESNVPYKDKLETHQRITPPFNCKATCMLFHESDGEDLKVAIATQSNEGFYSDTHIEQTEGGHGESTMWSVIDCPAALDRCPMKYKLNTKPKFTLRCKADAYWYAIGTMAAARSAGYLDVSLENGINGCSGNLARSLAVHDRGSTTVGGTLGPSGIGINFTFNPQGITEETLEAEAMLCNDWVEGITATVHVSCWNHIRSVANGGCTSLYLPKRAISKAEVTDWNPNYNVTAEEIDTKCSGTNEIKPF